MDRWPYGDLRCHILILFIPFHHWTLVITIDTHTLSPREHSTLKAPLRNSEIKNALFSFDPTKAPGPDALHPMFYQKYWNSLEDKVTSFCKQVFHTLEMNFAVNTTYLCLIPKCANATLLKNFRPIGLCNTMYKLINKIIFNTIKHVLVQEYISHFKKIKGKNANMILKIYLEKAFDMLEWSFIKDTLLSFRFPDNITKMILSCSTSSISVLVNGGRTKYFKPSRGIR